MVSSWSEPLASAYAACEAMARAHYENFPVASRLLPAAMRPHVAAVYAYARVADDIADEGSAPAADRLERLSAWQGRLHAAVAADGSAPPPATDADRVVFATAHSIRALDLPTTLFDDLVSAFGQDTTTTRYDSWRDLLDYCRRSANPVGRLVLRVAGYRRDDLDRSSDAFCTALQLTNFWQDLGRDWKIGRIYVPRDVYTACGAREDDLGGTVLTEAWSRAIADCVCATAALFQQGRAVCDGVAGRLRYELRFTWLGGRRILERVEACRRRLTLERPTLGAADAPLLLWRAARWSASS